MLTETHEKCEKFASLPFTGENGLHVIEIHQ